MAVVNDRAREDFLRRQEIWLREMGHYETGPRGYQRTAALLLGWDPDGGDPGVTGEVRTH